MKCANCGKEIRESDAFCPYCGEQLTNFITGDHRSGHRETETDDMTYIGSYDDPQRPVTLEEDRTFSDSRNMRDYEGKTDDDRTYLDSYYAGSGFGKTDDDRTYFDSQRFQDYEGEDGQFLSDGNSYSKRIGSDGFQRGNPSYPGTFEAAASNQRINTFSGDFSRGSGNTSGFGNGYGTAAPVSRLEASTPPPRSSAFKAAVIGGIVLLLLLALGAAFFVYRGRTPDPDPMTYDELVTDYGLANDNSDKIKAAYNDSVRIEFEDVSKGSSGYKATAVIYSPDMEKIYDKTTDESGVVDRLERTSDDDLHKTRKVVILDAKNYELTQNSAEELKETADRQFITIDEYNAEKQTESANSKSTPSDTGEVSADSGNTTTNTYNNYTYNVDNGSTDASEQDNSVASAPSSSGSGYVIPDSSSRYISSSELNGLSKWQCCIARNEIYARHGRMFVRDDLQSYFNSCSWYTPTVAASSFNEGVLNSYEKKNIQTIKSYEQAHGYL